MEGQDARIIGVAKEGHRRILEYGGSIFIPGTSLQSEDRGKNTRRRKINGRKDVTAFKGRKKSLVTHSINVF